MIEFTVDDVDRRTIPPDRARDLPALFERRLGRGVEAVGIGDRCALPGNLHPLVGAVSLAWRAHYALELRPDDIWLAIAQGFAGHVSANAEALRSRFVAHEGKLQLAVRRDHFIKGSPDNEWEGVYAEFSDRIAEHIGREKQRLFVCDFSTSGPREKAASELALMDAMSRYFEFGVRTMCGFPLIRLAGERADWQSIRDRAAVLAEYDLGWWSSALVPVLESIVASFDRPIDKAFWRSLFKYNGASGGPYVNGWINVLFPYRPDHDRRIGARSLVKNDRYAARWSEGMNDPFGGGLAVNAFPSGLSRVPFKWQYRHETFQMEFLGGFITTTFRQEGEIAFVAPGIGWAVRDVTGQPNTDGGNSGSRERGAGVRPAKEENRVIAFLRRKLSFGKPTNKCPTCWRKMHPDWPGCPHCGWKKGAPAGR